MRLSRAMQYEDDYGAATGAAATGGAATGAGAGRGSHNRGGMQHLKMVSTAKHAQVGMYGCMD